MCSTLRSKAKSMCSSMISPASMTLHLTCCKTATCPAKPLVVTLIIRLLVDVGGWLQSGSSPVSAAGPQSLSLIRRAGCSFVANLRNQCSSSRLLLGAERNLIPRFAWATIFWIVWLLVDALGFETASNQTSNGCLPTLLNPSLSLWENWAWMNAHLFNKNLSRVD